MGSLEVEVPASGPTPCKIAVVGEAPGKEELRLKAGFVGPSGQILWQMLRQYCGLIRDDVWVTNVCKRPLTQQESRRGVIEDATIWRDILEAELIATRATAIFTFGRHALNALAPGRRLEVVHGRAVPGPRWFVLPTYHPAAAMRNSGKLAVIAVDLMAFSGESP